MEDNIWYLIHVISDTFFWISVPMGDIHFYRYNIFNFSVVWFWILACSFRLNEQFISRLQVLHVSLYEHILWIYVYLFLFLHIYLTIAQPMHTDPWELFSVLYDLFFMYLFSCWNFFILYLLYCSLLLFCCRFSDVPLCCYVKLNFSYGGLLKVHFI